MNPISLLQSLIKMPSFSRDEKEVADFLQRTLEEEGYAVQRTDNNVWMMNPGYDERKPTLLLNAHIDTVKPVAAWTRDPFEPTIENETLYGLGANDDGASLVALLAVYLRLIEQPQAYNLIFAASAEEEVSGKNGMEKLVTVLPTIDFAIVGEPTQMNLAVAEKGLMVLDVTSHGKAGHAARNEGENAIYRALEDVEWFRNYEFEKKTDLLGAVKMTVTQITAGTQHNVIPDKCTFVVDVRSNECYSNAEILEIIKTNVNSEVKERSLRLNSTATPMNTIVEKAMQMGAQTFGSPTLSDQALMPFPSVKIGPGDSARSHTADEYIMIQEIEHAIEFYYNWLNKLVVNG